MDERREESKIMRDKIMQRKFRNSLRFSPLFIGKIHEHFPIVRRHGVLSLTDVIAETVAGQSVQRGHGRDVEAFYTEETINRIGGLKHFELAGGIGPLIPFGCAEKDRAGRTKGYQAILVNGQPVWLIIEFFEFRIEPVRKPIVNRLNRFAVGTPARGAATAAGLVREGNRDTVVEGGCEECCLAVARMSDHRDSMRIYIRISDEIVHAAMETPGPGGDRATICRIIFFRIASRQPGINSGA